MRGFTLTLASCALLVGCGGGGGSGSTATPAPSPAPAPSSTPTPTPSPSGLNTGEIKPSAGATLIAASMELTTIGNLFNCLTGATPGASTGSRLTGFDPSSFAVSYGTTTGYDIRDAVNSAVFGPAQLVSDTTNTAPFPPVLFARAGSGTEDYLALYKNVNTTTSILGTGTVTPSFAGNGGWQHTVLNEGSRRTRLDYFAFGTPTPESAMPRSGVVKFSLMGAGNLASDTDLYFMSYNTTVTVDFDAGTVTAIVAANGSNLFTGGVGGLLGITLAGPIIGNAVSGPTTSSVAVASGQFRLLFIGPNAEEMIVTFVGNDGRADYVASGVGVRNPYIP